MEFQLNEHIKIRRKDEPLPNRQYLVIGTKTVNQGTFFIVADEEGNFLEWNIDDCRLTAVVEDAPLFGELAELVEESIEPRESAPAQPEDISGKKPHKRKGKKAE